MKRVLFLIIGLFACSFLFGNQVRLPFNYALSPTQVHNLSVLAKLWGFLKYNHPDVARGRYDWDTVLVNKIQPFLEAKSSKAINTIVESWLNGYTIIDSCNSCETNTSHKVASGPDTTWFTTSGFSNSVLSRLRIIMKNRSRDAHYYFTSGSSGQIRIINENSYNSAKYPAFEWRLLTLFRYWNIVQYFSPYRSYTTMTWDSVLIKFIPLFYQAKDTLEYHLAILKMIASLEDGHNAITWSAEMVDFFGSHRYVPFQCQVVDGKAIVTKIYDDSICRQQEIKLYDIIDSIDGQQVSERVSRYISYVYNASNTGGGMAALCERFLFTGNDSNCNIVIWTPGTTVKKLIGRYSSTSEFKDPTNKKSAKLLPGNIGYINMELLKRGEVDSVMQVFSQTKGIILDLRHYPQDSWMALASKLAPKKFEMCQMTYPDLSCPGRFLYFPPRQVGQENNSSYKGKVVILVNSYTKSHGEFSAMGFQAATNTITIGTMTAGADGNLTDWIMLPGGFRTRFSGLGIYYPDGTLAQRNGVKIDITCRPTIKGALSRTDELLETAIRVINSGD